LIHNLKAEKVRFDKCIELGKLISNERSKTVSEIWKFIDMPQMHLTQKDKASVKQKINSQLYSLENKFQSIILELSGFKSDYSFNNNHLNLLENFCEGYNWIFTEIKEHLQAIERENNLENIQVGSEGLEEFLESKIYKTESHYYHGENHEFIQNLTDIILEDEEMKKRIITDNHGYYSEGNYCDELLEYLAFYPGSMSRDFQTHQNSIIRSIETALSKYIDFDSVACHMFHSSGPAKTVYGEILNECRRLQYRWNNDGDTGWNPTDCVFHDHVNLIELIRSIPQKDLNKLIDAINSIFKEINGYDMGIAERLYHEIENRYDDDKYRFSMDIFDEECCATGAYIIYSALVKIASEEFPDTPLDKIDYSKVKFLNQENTWDCRHGVIKSQFTPRKSYYNW